MTYQEMEQLYAYLEARYQRIGSELERVRGWEPGTAREWRERLATKALFSTWMDLEQLRGCVSGSGKQTI
jgi:hypothetical protein